MLFHDAGNVYSRPENISFRGKQEAVIDGAGELDGYNFDYMVHAVGFGIRYGTPIGPMRFDFAHSINPPRFVGFSGPPEDLMRDTGKRISKFQFHFSLGQTF